MDECKRMKEDDTQVTKDVRSKWNSMSDAEKELYITQSRNDNKEYKERRKAHENKVVSTRCIIKRVNSLVKHLKEKAVLGVENEGKSVVEVWDELKARVLLYIVSIFLCPTGDTSTNKDYMKLICDEGLKVPAYERTGVARIRAWGKEEVVIGKKVEEAVEAEEKKEEMVVLGDDGEVEGKIDGVVKEVEVLRGEVVKEVEVLRGDLKMVMGEKFDGLLKEVVELRSELTGVKGVVDQYLDEGDQLKAYLDSECPAPQKKNQKVEKADIPSGIDDIEVAICDYLWNSELESGVYDVATLKPTEWVGGVVIDLLAWTVYYDSQKSLRRIGYLPYLLAIMITINYHNLHWYLLVLDMVDRVATIYDSMFTSEAAKQRVNDVKRLVKLLIFDLNGVLAYIPRLPADVVLRTGLFEFMQFCVDNFVVVIWSSKMRYNVDRVLEKLPLFSEHFLFVWDQAKCKTYDNVTYCKYLNDVWNSCPNFNELNTLLVDDSAEKMIYNPKYNYICPHTFDAASHSNDSALEKGGNIREYLENLLKAPNVSDFVRNNPFSSD
ncbi:hypothetical protein F3Y22_tig00110788pilonHSYRG00370 [Hibiscus syriacus]|uniref:Mitochondrial import inner membrane translocase subunit TIM50 n=1 Tax=Hibiscus syriacus TaxID=106335 RepID=A0A6A2ZRA6_HIBSY|nr:hypothetical protein F3Y22_tig00110788pilonHSYRG00370 [Hibiscus syriacus]